VPAKNELTVALALESLGGRQGGLGVPRKVAEPLVVG
jgi:hypothetical protein